MEYVPRWDLQVAVSAFAVARYLDDRSPLSVLIDGAFVAVFPRARLLMENLERLGPEFEPAQSFMAKRSDALQRLPRELTHDERSQLATRVLAAGQALQVDDIDTLRVFIRRLLGLDESLATPVSVEEAADQTVAEQSIAQEQQVRALIDDVAARPSAKTWRWLQRALGRVSPPQRDALVAYADTAIAHWPDELRDDGPATFSSGSRRERTTFRADARWRLVRTLTVAGAFKPVPSMASDGPASLLTGLRLSNVTEADVALIEAWPGISSIKSLHITGWKSYSPGLAARLLDALDPAVVTDLALRKQKPAAQEIVSALSSRDWPALRCLAFTSCRDEHMAELLTSSWIRHLERLELSAGPPSAQGMVGLVRGLGSPSVTSLHVMRPLSPAVAGQIAESYPGLQVLRAAFQEGALAAFCERASTTSLRHLEIASGSGATADDFAELGSWSGASALRVLSGFSTPSIDDEAVAGLFESDHLLGLQSLSLRRCGISDASVTALADWSGAADLHTLVLEDCDIGDAGACAIAASPHLTNLRDLDLSATHIGLAGLRAILASRVASNLQGLHLSSLSADANALGDAGARLIAASTKLSRLRRLSLAGQNMSWSVLRGSLATAPHLHDLEELDLSDNPGLGDGAIAESALRAAGFTHLRELRCAEEII